MQYIQDKDTIHEYNLAENQVVWTKEDGVLSCYWVRTASENIGDIQLANGLWAVYHGNLQSSFELQSIVKKTIENKQCVCTIAPPLGGEAKDGKLVEMHYGSGGDTAELLRTCEHNLNLVDSYAPSAYDYVSLSTSQTLTPAPTAAGGQNELSVGAFIYRGIVVVSWDDATSPSITVGSDTDAFRRAKVVADTTVGRYRTKIWYIDSHSTCRVQYEAPTGVKIQASYIGLSVGTTWKVVVDVLDNPLVIPEEENAQILVVTEDKTTKTGTVAGSDLLSRSEYNSTEVADSIHNFLSLKKSSSITYPRAEITRDVTDPLDEADARSVVRIRVLGVRSEVDSSWVAPSHCNKPVPQYPYLVAPTGLDTLNMQSLADFLPNTQDDSAVSYTSWNSMYNFDYDPTSNTLAILARRNTWLHTDTGEVEYKKWYSTSGLSVFVRLGEYVYARRTDQRYHQIVRWGMNQIDPNYNPSSRWEVVYTRAQESTTTKSNQYGAVVRRADGSLSWYFIEDGYTPNKVFRLDIATDGTLSGPVEVTLNPSTGTTTIFGSYQLPNDNATVVAELPSGGYIYSRGADHRIIGQSESEILMSTGDIVYTGGQLSTLSAARPAQYGYADVVYIAPKLWHIGPATSFSSSNPFTTTYLKPLNLGSGFRHATTIEDIT